MINNLEFLVDPEIALKQYFSSRNMLYILLTVNLLLETLLTLYVMTYESAILD